MEIDVKNYCDEANCEKTHQITDKNQHIMFSYSWKQKHDVRHIYDILCNEYEDIPKWIDTEGMSGNILETMHNAVDDAFLVIIFISKDYKNSKNCKIESELIIGKQKNFIIVLTESGFPFLEEDEQDNWVQKMYKDQFYIDLSQGMEQEKIDKLINLTGEKINNYYGFNLTSKKPSFMRKRSLSTFSLSSNKSTSFSNNNKRTSPLLKDLSIPLKNAELDSFILNNDLGQDEVDNIKNLMLKTPRTMIPTLKASGLSFKGILEILNEIKNEDD
tara:strand:+ start:151 stop:969 length:819 start_codon:yes stop_codon:yes gene_type:complete